MGNCVSCTFSMPRSTVRILDLEGHILRRVEIPMKVAEIMLEAPGKFISPADVMLKTHRVPAMRADEELQAGKLYVLVPVGRLNSRVSEEEMGVFAAACCQKSSGAKVFPAVAAERIEKTLPNLRMDDVESDGGFPGPG